MKRLDFYLSEHQIEKLKKKSSEMDIKTSDLLRRIIDYYFDKEDDKNAEKINSTRSKEIKSRKRI